MKKFVLFASLFLNLNVWAQTQLLDDFNRANSNTVGNSWVEVETTAGTGIAITTNQLKLNTGAASGVTYAYRDVSALYNTVFNSNSSILTWSFNMRHTRPSPSGFSSGGYGAAFVLGCSTNNFLAGNGYAVVHGNTGDPDCLRLVHFTGGVQTLGAALTNDIINGAVDYGTDYLTVKVTYNPVGNAWSLYIGSNLGAFDDPALATYTQLGATTANSLHVGTDLMFLGGLWNHATTTAENVVFDNVRVPNLCVLSTEPTVQTSGISVTGITANSMTLNYTRGDGGSVIIICKKGGAVTSVPVDLSSYIASTSYGSGTLMAVDEYVVYQGSANSVTITNLLPTTNYQFALFEFNGSGCMTNYLTTAPLTASATTIACALLTEPTTQASAVSVSNLGTNSATVSWTRGNGATCIVIAKPVSAVTGLPADGSAYNANSIYGLGDATGPGEYVVYNGTGSSVNVTGLSPSTTYHFSVFEFNGVGCSTNYNITSASSNGTTLAAIVYNLYRGNIHAHSDYSDGDMDNFCDGANSPTCCYTVANTALNFDFVGISDHNHNLGPIMTPARYLSGVSEASAFNIANPDFTALYGMEFGTISTGGHINIYGIDSLVGWTAGNYHIYCNQGDYTSLYGLVNSRPGAFAYLVHPNTTDYNNLFTNPYNLAADNAIVGVSLRNGPYASTSTTYNDPPAAAPDVPRYHDLLKKGYHVGPGIDHDNHNSATFGKSSQGRTVILAQSRSKATIMDAYRNMRFYATDDYNTNISFTLNTSNVMGSIVSQTINPILDVTYSDPDGADGINKIEIFYGVPGSGVDPTLLTSNTATATLNYTHVIAAGTTYYYYAKITQNDGHMMWTSPIWYTKALTLPIDLMCFDATKHENGVLVNWSTASEKNVDHFVLERSIDNITYETLDVIAANGSEQKGAQYKYVDLKPVLGTDFYRIRQVDIDGQEDLSHSVKVVFVESLINNSPLSVFPNPSTGIVNINFFSNLESSKNVSVINVLGEIVYEVYVNSREGSNTLQLDLSKIPTGIYSVCLTDRVNNEQQQVRLVVEGSAK